MDAQTLLAEARRIGEENRRGAESYKGPPLRFTHLDNDREAAMPWLSHTAMAGRVRMLLRTDLDHESVVCAERDNPDDCMAAAERGSGQKSQGPGL